MHVSVFGLGYVGCVTAACLARNGHTVVGVDLNSDKVDLINAGRAPIVEPGLDDLVREMVEQGRLSATTDVAAAVAATSLALIAVGTPSGRGGRPQLDAVGRVGRDIGAALAGRSDPFAVVLRSTALPGTTENVLTPAIREGAGGRLPDVQIAVNPEFMREGCSLEDFDHPPFLLVGCSEPRTGALIRTLYAEVKTQMVRTSIRTAELVKYASNAFHAVKVCFANEVGDIAAALGADGADVMRIFALDRKLNVSAAYLTPGFAFGGSCLPKDVRGLLWAGHTGFVDTPLLSAVLPSNEHQIQRAIDRVAELGRRRIGVVGLAFKPNTDDLRESPVVRVVEALIGKGFDVRVLDANVSIARLVGANRRYIESEIPHIASLLTADPAELLDHAEVLVVGSRSAEAEAAIALAGPDVAVVDLTRSLRGAEEPVFEAVRAWA